MKKRKRINIIITWFVCFIALSIILKGMGIYRFETRWCSIDRYIDDMCNDDGIQENSNGLVLNFSSEENTAAGGVYGVALVFAEKADIGNLEVYFAEEPDKFSNDNWQAMPIEYEHDKLIIRFTFGYGGVRLCTANPIKSTDVRSFGVIVKSSTTKLYVFAGIFSLIMSLIFYILKGKYQFLITFRVKFSSYIKDRKFWLTVAFITLEGFAICCMEAAFYVYVRGYFLNPCRVFMLWCMASVITVALRHKEVITKNFHIFYFFLLLSTGTIYIVGCAPYSLDLSWDDQVHYARANYVARGFQSYETEAGYQLKAHYFDRGTLEDNFTKEKRVELAEYIGSLDRNLDYDGFRYVNSHFSRSACISYLPAAIGLVIGRGLGMHTMTALLLGRWSSLLCYSLILSYAVWLLRKRGYIIAAFIGLTPVAVFLAGNYSYDWWLTSLLILGYALLEQVEMNKNKQGIYQLFKILSVMFLAILPKAVYVTMMVPMIVVFASKGKKNKKSIFFAVAICIILASSFLIPLIVSKGAAYSDTRGGADVNSLEQIRFILTKPLQYTKILARFLWRYINSDNSVAIFGYYILFGTGKFWSVALILLVIGTLVDNNVYQSDEIRKVNALRLWSGVGILGTLVLISTALYVSFTPVMSTDILGVQARYIIPLLFPLLFYICKINLDIPQRIKNNVAVYGSMIMAGIFCFNIYVQCICFY